VVKKLKEVCYPVLRFNVGINTLVCDIPLKGAAARRSLRMYLKHQQRVNEAEEPSEDEDVDSTWQ
jgi:hypothetical protein